MRDNVWNTFPTGRIPPFRILYFFRFNFILIFIELEPHNRNRETTLEAENYVSVSSLGTTVFHCSEKYNNQPVSLSVELRYANQSCSFFFIPTDSSPDFWQLSNRATSMKLGLQCPNIPQGGFLKKYEENKITFFL